MMIYVKCNKILDGCIEGKCPYLNPVLVDSEDIPKCPYIPSSEIKPLEDFMLCKVCANYIYNKHKGDQDKIIKCWRTNYKMCNI